MKSQAAFKWQNAFTFVMICLVVTLAVTHPAQPTQASPTTAAPVALVNAASYEAVVAPGSIAALFGAGLSTQTTIATTLPLPKTLGGVTVK
ncbi:MAG: hypothetical protein JNK38_02350, partial [Acidobacteria bacterium]|nr:hypothetical protein [Acidobacteriota bacterium]